MKFIPSSINKILIIKPRGIGDIILSTIVVDNLKGAFPGSEIHYLTEHFARQAVENNPLISNVHSSSKKEFALFVAMRLRKEKYDLVIDMWSNPRSAQITFLSGAKYRVGYSYRGRKYAYNIKAEVGRGEVHLAEHSLELLKAIDIPIISKNIHYHISTRSVQKAEQIITELNLNYKKLTGIIPSGGWESKRCDVEKWIEICKELITNFNSTLLILWGPGDENDVHRIKNAISEDVIIAPETTLDEMAALINNCELVIANDSGPMHIAAALKIPTVGLFGPTDPEKHGPYSEKSNYVIKNDLHCIICNKLTCPFDHECMKELPVNELLQKIEKLISERVT
jgi:lipopolysaccharide heptosyltransferase II